MTDTSTTQLDLGPITNLESVSARQESRCSTPGGLLFRIRGSSHHGRLVRISRRACSVGSDPNCGLRLVGSDIAPMHCLILRGRCGTAVRRWSPDTRLNGSDFVDEWLRPGDRLTIGRIELEFVSETKPIHKVDPGVRRQVPWSPNTPLSTGKGSTESVQGRQNTRRLHKQRVKRLCQSLRIANKQIDSLQGEIYQHHGQVEGLLAKVVRLEQFLSDESEIRTKTEEFESAVHKLEEECTNLREQSQRQRESWRRHFRDLAALVQADLDPDGDTDDDQLMQQLRDRVTERLALLTSSRERDRIRFEERLARQREQLDTQLQQLTEGQKDLIERESELERARHDLNKLWTDLDRAKNDQSPATNVSADGDDLPARLAEVQSQRDELQTELERLRADYQRMAGQRQRLESAAEEAAGSARQQADLQRQLADDRSELEEQRQQLRHETEEQLADLRQREAELAERIEEFDRRVAESQVRPATQADSVAEDLAARCEDLVQQLESARLAREEAESAIEELRRELSEREAAVASEGVEAASTPAEELEQAREQLAQEREQLQSDRDVVGERQKRLDESYHELAEERRALDREQEEWRSVRGQFEEKIEEHIDQLGAPVFSSIDRDFVGSDEPLDEDQEPEEVEFSMPDDSSPVDTSELRQFLPEEDDPPESESTEPESMGLSQASSGENDQDDQMISDYMQRLLNREGSSAESPATTSQPSPPTAKSEPRKSGTHHRLIDETDDAKSPKEFAPRIRAPELDLSVLRDIANESARSAINRYSFKVWLHAAVVRWSVSFVAFVTGVILLYWAQDFSTIAGFSGLAALVISLFWLLQGLWLTRFAWRSRIRYHSKAVVSKPTAHTLPKSVEEKTEDNFDDQ